MEDISTWVIELGKYGILGVFLTIAVFVIKYLYSQQKIKDDATILSLRENESEFKAYLKETNEKLFDIVKDNTAAYKLITEAFDKNTIVNEKFTSMVESKLDVLEMLKKTKEKV